ncbi:rhodanese-like/PpiC domain-containing protein 12 isoform X2 [Tripterygium wilfordii]|uniref:Peptidyl-prolyl cis-trans isomerase n=1 Tax=Tripterygium wilfordii TaxID=458696 RepID=A0A7J7DFB4_TRIWF|nr:rhodanese-like/PpiC domain-containing protein 12 isoform X2 [Tripterygium wilfordii]
MLRASPAAFTTLRQSLLPTLSLSSSSSFLHKFSTFASFSSFPPNSLEPNSLRLSSLCFRRPPFLMDPPCPRGTARASFSAEGCSKGEREVLVQHLLVKEDGLNLLLDIQQRVEKGEDLSDLAAEYSICPSKEEGGMLGWVGKGQMVPEFEEAAFDAPLNKVVKCKTKFGWHLLQVLSERYIGRSVLLNIILDKHFQLPRPALTLGVFVSFLICISCYQGRINASRHPTC